eukprot:505715-Pyramimonas_sp.AAC.1
MEGGRFSKCGSRLSARTFALKLRKSFNGRERAVFKMWLSPQRREHSFSTLARASRIEAGSFTKCGSRHGAEHKRPYKCA